MSTDVVSSSAFEQFDLIAPVQQAVQQSGYHEPTPIQIETIPHLLAGRDILGQAQTGTGKTAAFALPLLSRIDLQLPAPQVLVLAPTRELAIQVSEAFQRYAACMPELQVATIYGGQGYEGQLRQLKQGSHIVVGTPGRVMDHMRRDTLRLESIRCLVLDEADEMLRMGFVDDVQWILERLPAEHQTALFSATLPAPIRDIAKRHMQDPATITIAHQTVTADTVRQRFWICDHSKKLAALDRILEGESIEGAIVFVKTRNTTNQLAEKLNSLGYAAAALNGEMPQSQRERTVEQLRDGRLNILVATDVAARGLDLPRISHVINFDLPYDTEAYIHRIGRTGRAGRNGEAILFVAPRERGRLRMIEKATRQRLEQLKMPSVQTINEKRIANFQEQITQVLEGADLSEYEHLLEQYQQETGTSPLRIAAALATLVRGSAPLLLKEEPKQEHFEKSSRRDRHRDESNDGESHPRRSKRPPSRPEAGMERFRIEVGSIHNVKPNNIVGAIAAEAGLDSEYIGRIDIFDDHSTVDLPDGMPRDVFYLLKRVRIVGRQMRITRLEKHSKQQKGRGPRRPNQPSPKMSQPSDGRKSKPKGKRQKAKRKAVGR